MYFKIEIYIKYDIILIMKNELEMIKKNYLSKNLRYGYYSLSVAKKLLNILPKCQSFERPDFYYLENDICYIFEHFQFDASKTLSKKGSSFKLAEIKSQRIIDNKTKEKLKTQPSDPDNITNYGAFSTAIKCEQNKIFWKSNFLNNFLNHYNKINLYRENLINAKVIDSNTKIKNVFIIEDTTEFGAYKSFNSENVSYPFDFDFGIDALGKAKKINYFIFLNKSQPEMFFVNRKSIKLMKQHQLNFDKTKMFFFNNIVSISALVTVPDKLLKK